MIDVEKTLRAELERLVEIDPRRDWEDVERLAGLRRARERRVWAAGAGALAIAAILGIATPFGSALARGLDDFSTWLTGDPGTPVSQEEQREFDAANAGSWLGFPEGTKLRRLITHEVGGGTTVDLLGFRSASSSLCLRLIVSGESRTATLSCAPLAELHREGGPARVLIADYGVGKGDKNDWYATSRVHAAALQITAGVVTDDVTSVVLEDDAGRHEVPAKANAFLYVAEDPDVGQRVRQVSARTSDGLVRVPFAPAPFGYGGGAVTRQLLPAPTVERSVSGGRIGWLEDREPRGEPLDVLPAGVLPPRLTSPGPASDVLFGRVLAPDPGRPMRLVVTLNANRTGGPPAGLCTWHVTSGGGAGGGCTPYPDIFERSLMPATGSMARGSDAFLTLSGIASDDVARLEALLADGQRAEVPLRDNAFLVDVPRAKLPARLVAYDSDDRVIDVSEQWQDVHSGSGPAKGRPTSLLRVEGPNGSHAELLVGPATDGGECMYVKHFVDPQHAGTSVSCGKGTWQGRALQLGSQFLPPRFIDGRVRDDVRTVRINFADGESTTLTPERGYVLWAAPAERLSSGRGAVAAEGLDADGKVVGATSFKPPPGRPKAESTQCAPGAGAVSSLRCR